MRNFSVVSCIQPNIPIVTAILLALCFTPPPSLAGNTKPQIILLHPRARPPDPEALVMPAGSPVRLVSLSHDLESNAVFHGRFTVSGVYEAEGSGDDVAVTMYPDRASLRLLPHWREQGGPDEIYISNSLTFAQAVISQEQLRKLKADKMRSVRGRITVIADDYKTSLECDGGSFEMRVISLAKPSVRIAGNPKSEEGC